MGHPLPPDSMPAASRKSHEFCTKEKLCLGKVQGIRAGNIHRSMASLSAIASSDVNRCSTENHWQSAGPVQGCGNIRRLTCFTALMGGLDELASDPVRTNQAKRIITRGYSIKGFCRQCSSLFHLRRAQIRIILSPDSHATKRPNHDRWPEIFRLAMEDFASITALTLASFSRN